MLLEGMFRLPVTTMETPLSAEFPALFPIEEKAIANAATRRRREFAAGRNCARQAMNALGLIDMAIPMGSDRAPVWPSGIAGSISHSATYCVAAVGRDTDGIKSIGIDIERAASMDEDLAEHICTPVERTWLLAQNPSTRGLLKTAIFCAKESTYKCQYPLSRTLFGFEAIRIELDLAAESFAAYFEIDAGPFRVGDRLEGRIGFRQDHVVSGMTIG